jgi:hypothetical protein
MMWWRSREWNQAPVVNRIPMWIKNTWNLVNWKCQFSIVAQPGWYRYLWFVNAGFTICTGNWTAARY